jgi:RNA polymerase sigma-70 factor (ECF subfamily)
VAARRRSAHGCRRHEALAEKTAAQRDTAASSEDEDISNVLGVLHRLSKRDREVLCLAAWEGLSAPQAARVLGCTATAYRLRLYRARKRLAAGLAVAARDELQQSPLPSHPSEEPS